MIGKTIGPYQILAELGRGGMGEVYRATDSHLKRSVAIKVLPAAMAGDADRLMRFQREAEVLAALNHPNIAAIYGLEKTPDLTALVMELVEGQDLSEIISYSPGLKTRPPKTDGSFRTEAGSLDPANSRGGIPLSDALAIAKQIADALEAAHEQGIVHRDLKPQNIKVRADGTVKVLDFGLAKAMDRTLDSGPGTLDPRNSPTMTSPAMTAMGMILGTAAYMAPEQAKGRAVDKRADIWAFGVVLYEMLTGRRAFAGDDVSELLASVLRDTPDLAALPATIPPGVRRLLQRCLEKDPKKRLRDIGEARLMLDGPLDDTAPQVAAAAPASARRSSTAWIMATAVVLVAAAALAVPAVRHLSETPPPETRLDIVTPPTSQPSAFALSPDGTQIVFAASSAKGTRLWLRSLSTTTAEPLEGTEGATLPFWSPDSRTIGFFADGSLKRLNLSGGAPQTLAPANNGSGGTWNADDVIVFAPTTTTPLMRVPGSGGSAVPVTTRGPQQYGHHSPHFLADGQRFVFRVGGVADESGTYIGDLDGSAPIRLLPDAAAVIPTPDNWLLWVRGGALVAQRLDVAQRAMSGTVVTVADGVHLDNLGSRSAVSVSATGLVAYRTTGGSERQLTWFDRAGIPRGVVGEPDASVLSPRASPDGRRIAVTRRVQDNEDIWLWDGARWSRFTFTPGRDQHSVWSPDSTRILYQSLGKGAGEMQSKLTSGAGGEEPLLANSPLLTPTSFSADGRILLYQTIDPTTNADLWVVPLSEGAKPGTSSAFLKTPFREAYGVFSPDGRWVAYHSNESGRPEVYVRPFVPPGATGAAPAAGAQAQVSTDGGIHAMWSHDGKEIYYIGPEGDLMAVPIAVKGATVEPGVPKKLFATRVFGGGADIQLGRQYDVTPDGRFLINNVLSDALAPITLLQHWNPDGKKK